MTNSLSTNYDLPSSSIENENNMQSNLFHALQQSDKERAVLELIDAADVNMADKDGLTALSHAVHEEKTARALIDYNLYGVFFHDDDINKTYEVGWAALFRAVYEQRMSRAVMTFGFGIRQHIYAVMTALQQSTESMVRALIGAGADVNIIDGYNKTALFYAVQQSNNEGVVLALINAGADVKMTDGYGKTALFYAVQQSDNVRVVHALIAAGADVNMTDGYGKTALFYAVRNSNKERVCNTDKQHNNVSVVRALIAAGAADVNMTDGYGKTALFYAVQQSNNESVVRALIDAGAYVNMTDGYGKTALFYAVQQSNNESVVRALIDAGADINITDKDGRTSLLHAVQERKNESVVLALIDAGADVNISEKFNNTTPLMKAIANNINENAICALINAGANVNTTDITLQTALFYAVQQSNNESVVRALFDAGADVNITDGYGKTVLFYAVLQSNQSMVLALINAGADVNMIDKDNKTALFYALQQSKNEGVIRALIDAGADVNMTNKYGKTAWLCVLQQSNNKRMVHALINAGADVNMTDKDDKTALFYAVQQSNTINEVCLLIHAGADVNITDKYGKTALFYALQQSNNERVVRALVDAGGDANITDKDGKTALFYALQQRNNMRVVRALIDAGADVNITDKYGKTAWLYALQQSNNESVVRTLIDAGAHDVNMTDEYGKTALSNALKQSKNESVVRALIDAGADVNLTDKYGKSALFHGVEQSNNESVVRALVDAGADVNMTNKEGETALFYAVQQSKNENVVRTLIESGADINITDKHGRTSLLHAVQQSNNESVVLALIDAGADVNTSNKCGYTALFYAVQQSNNESVARALIDAGADVNITDEHGRTALLLLVQQSNNESVVRALIDAGADITMSDEHGKPPLFYAVKQSNESMVRALIGSADVRDKCGRTAHFYVDLEYPSSLNCLLDAGGNRYLKVKDNCNVDILSFLIDKWVSSQDVSFACFKNGILDVVAKHGITRDSFAKAIVNILFLKSIDVFKSKYYKGQFWFSSDFSLEEKLQTLGELYCEYIGDESSERKSKMQRILKALKNGFPDISEVLELLEELDADPDSADSDGNTVLHYTTRLPLFGVPQKTVIDFCSQLQRFGTQINERNHQRQTALLFCLSADMHQLTDEVLSSAVKTFVHVCMFLVKQGSSMDEASKSGESVFHLIIRFFERCLKVKDEAIRKDVLREAMKLLQLFPPWKVAEEKTINKPDVHLNSPLHLWASLSSHLDYMRGVSNKDLTFEAILDKILKHFLECGAKVNARNENDETPLHLCKTWTAVKLLIGAGANFKDVDSTGSSPLLVGAKKAFDGNKDHFYPDVTEEPKVFWKTAVQMGLDPWTADKNDESVLSILVRSDSFVLSKALVDVACEEGYSKEVTVPLLNAICKDRSTRSHWKTVLVQDILKSRKCPTTASTPLLHCCRNIIETGVFGKTKSSIQNKVLAVDKSAIETPAAKGETERKLQTSSAAHNSVHCEIANLLRSYGADIETPDVSGESCLDVAEGHPALKDFLTKPLDTNAVPIVIPWTSTSTKYEDRMAKVARRQECKMVDEIWYHKDHIGSGSFGSIFAGINEKDGREVAIKRIEKLRMQRPEDRREIKNLIALADCEQVVRYISFFEDENFSHIVLELMEGNLEEYLNASTTDATQATLLCKDVVMGLKFLHERKILHRDLKPKNILYKLDPNRVLLKIADFGLSRRRIIDSVSTTVYGTHAGTRCWIAPEVLNSKANKVDKNCFEPASDMFSCGLILHYILSGQKHPFNPTDCTNKSELKVAHETEDNIMKGKVEGWDNSLSPEATHLVKRMLESNEKHRPSAEEALEHPLFWSNEKKMDFLKAVGNQKEFECPRSRRTIPLTSVETDLEMSFGTLVTNGKCKWPWDDPGYLHMPGIYTGMTTGKGRKKYDKSSAVELVRFIRNVYEHYREKTFVTAVPIKQMLFDDFVFLEYFPDLVMEVYKAVTPHGWDKTRDDIKSTMNKK